MITTLRSVVARLTRARRSLDSRVLEASGPGGLWSFFGSTNRTGTLSINFSLPEVLARNAGRCATRSYVRRSIAGGCGRARVAHQLLGDALVKRRRMPPTRLRPPSRPSPHYPPLSVRGDQQMDDDERQHLLEQLEQWHGEDDGVSPNSDDEHGPGRARSRCHASRGVFHVHG